MASGFGESGTFSGSNSSVFPESHGIAGVSSFGSISGVVQGSTADVLIYIVPPGRTFYLQLVEVGGNNIAKYELEVDGATIALLRTWFSGPLTERMRFDGTGNVGLVFSSGTTIKTKVTNFRPAPGEFEARIVGVLK